MNPPAVDYEHLFRMSDDTGLLEHAKGAIPRREHGYCLDDVARGLVVLSRERDPSQQVLRLAGTYLAFTAHAQDTEGSFRNRLAYDRRWLDQPSTGDWWGRAMWALGSVATSCGPEWLRVEALDRFSLGCRQRSPWLRASAFAALGAAEVVTLLPDHTEARSLLVDFVGSVGWSDDDAWPWPEARLSYANARIPDALLAAGAALGAGEVVERGTALLDWLVRWQTIDDHLSPVPVGGTGSTPVMPGFDQQPIEIAALADAAARAFELSGEDRWSGIVERAVAWFDGANDVGTPMRDAGTGGGYDGLTATGPNLNQGAESTIAWLLTVQHAPLVASGGSS